MDKPNIKISPADTVDTFATEMIQVLCAVGHPEAFVTDESQVSDFLINICVPCPEEVAALEKALGRKIRVAVPCPEEDADIIEHNDTILKSLAALMGRDVSGYEHLGLLARELHLQAVPVTRH